MAIAYGLGVSPVDWGHNDWDDVLPPCIWISTGEHEILFEDVVTWANNLRKGIIWSERVELEIGKNEVHVWQ